MAHVHVGVKNGKLELTGDVIADDIDITNGNAERLIWFSIADAGYRFSDRPIGLKRSNTKPDDWFNKQGEKKNAYWNVRDKRVTVFDVQNFVLRFPKGGQIKREEWYNLHVIDGQNDYFLDPKIKNGGQDPPFFANNALILVVIGIALVSFTIGAALF